MNEDIKNGVGLGDLDIQIVRDENGDMMMIRLPEDWSYESPFQELGTLFRLVNLEKRVFQILEKRIQNLEKHNKQ